MRVAEAVKGTRENAVCSNRGYCDEKTGLCQCLEGFAGSDANDSGVPGLELDHNGNFKAFDFEAQVHSVFANVKSILEASGSSWEQLVDVTVFLVDMNRDFHTFNRLYAEYFKDNQPCRTTMEINRLPTPIAIELKCIATIE